MKQKIELVIDCAGSNIFVGVLDHKNQWKSQISCEGTALENLFPSVKAALKDASINLSNLSGFVYCEGPGSVLGLRLCAMAIETWRRLYPNSSELYKYNSLQLSSLILLEDNADLKEALIVSDWKKGAWNSIQIRATSTEKVKVIDDDALTSWNGKLYHLPQRKGWQSPPLKAKTLLYSPERISELGLHTAVFKATDQVEIYNNAVNTFQKWTPSRHGKKA